MSESYCDLCPCSVTREHHSHRDDVPLTSIMNNLLPHELPGTVLAHCRPKINVSRTAPIFTDLCSVDLFRGETSLTRPIRCGVKQGVRVSPRYVEVVLRMNQLQVDVPTLLYHVCQSSCSEPRFLYAVGKEPLEERIWSQGRKNWYDAADGICGHERRDVRERCNKDYTLKVDSILNNEMLCYGCRHCSAKALPKEYYPLRRDTSDFQRPFDYSDAINDESFFVRTACRIAKASIVYSQNVDFFRSSRRQRPVRVSTPSLSDCTCITVDCGP